MTLDSWEDDIDKPLHIEIDIIEQVDVVENNICEICGKNYPKLNSLSQHQKTCTLGNKLFKDLIGESLSIDKEGFSDFLRKNGWNTIIRCWCLDTTKNKKIVITDSVKQQQTRVYYEKQSHLILWALTQLYLQFLGLTNSIEGTNGWSEKTHLSLTKAKNLFNIYSQPLWNGWRSIVKDILPTLPPKFDGMDIIPVENKTTTINTPIVTKRVNHIEMNDIKNEINLLRGNALFYSFDTLSDAIKVKNFHIRYKDFFKNIGFKDPDIYELPSSCFNLSNTEFEEDISKHEVFVKTFINTEFSNELFLIMIEELKTLSHHLYLPYGELIFKNIKTFISQNQLKDKKFLLTQLGRKSILSNSLNGSLGRRIHNEKIFEKIKLSIN